MGKFTLCDVCGIDEAVLVYHPNRVCRDCFASLRANAILAAMETAVEEGEAEEDSIDYDKALEEGYSDADTLLNGGRLPY